MYIYYTYIERKWVEQKLRHLSSITDNVGLYAELGGDSEDDDWERKEIEKMKMIRV